VEFKIGGRTSLVLHVYARAKGKQTWQDFQYRLEENPPHKLKELAFIAEVAEPIALPNGAITHRYTLD
jgi:hypothetical protein